MNAFSQRRLILRSEAEREIAEAAEWYDGRRPGLGSEFLDAVDACIDSVLEGPESYPVARGAVRRAVLRRFPYNLVYTMRPRELIVLGCLHGRRNPRAWQNRA